MRGRDIKRYGYDFADLWVIATFPSRHYDIDQYPAVKRHLLTFGIERLEQTGKTYTIDGKTVKARKKTNNKWFETQDSIGYWEDFNKQKIMWSDISSGANSFALDMNNMLILNTGYILTNKNNNHLNLRYLLSVLNSRAILFYMSIITSSLGDNGYRWIKEYVDMLPIPECIQEGKFAKLFEDVISLEILSTDMAYNIDIAILKLYDLSDEEIYFIMNKFQNLKMHSSNIY